MCGIMGIVALVALRDTGDKPPISGDDSMLADDVDIPLPDISDDEDDDDGNDA